MTENKSNQELKGVSVFLTSASIFAVVFVTVSTMLNGGSTLSIVLGALGTALGGLMSLIIVHQTYRSYRCERR